MLKKYFLLILSHSKSKHRESQLTNLLNQKYFDKFITYYFIGSKDLESEYKIDHENNIIYLNVSDNYESLSLKTLKSISFIEENFKGSIKGVFKTDDDIDINLELLYNCLEVNCEEIYFGNKTTVPESKSSYHFGKCEDPRFNNTLLDVPINTHYCSGGGYYINSSVLGQIIKHDEPFYKILFEDVATGKCLADLGHIPKYVDIKQFCKWETEQFFNLDFDTKHLPKNAKIKLILSDEDGNFDSTNILNLGNDIKPPARIRLPSYVKLSPDGPYKLKILVD